MIDYFKNEQLEKAFKQKKANLVFYLITLGLYLGLSTFMFIWYFGLPYGSPDITKLKWIFYPVTVAFVIYSFLFLGIRFKRVKKYYRKCYDLSTGIRESTTGSFIEYNENIQQKDGVDFKSLIFLEWNKYKKDFFERKVLIFYEEPFPEIPESANVTYVTVSNVLVSYEILS